MLPSALVGSFFPLAMQILSLNSTGKAKSSSVETLNQTKTLQCYFLAHLLATLNLQTQFTQYNNLNRTSHENLHLSFMTIQSKTAHGQCTASQTNVSQTDCKHCGNTAVSKLLYVNQISCRGSHYLMNPMISK